MVTFKDLKSLKRGALRPFYCHVDELAIDSQVICNRKKRKVRMDAEVYIYVFQYVLVFQADGFCFLDFFSLILLESLLTAFPSYKKIPFYVLIIEFFLSTFHHLPVSPKLEPVSSRPVHTPITTTTSLWRHCYLRLLPPSLFGTQCKVRTSSSSQIDI